MTNLDDFDRSLSTFLADGPTIAPEAPVVAALAHARTTPRRWDPFAALRRDVMARPFGLGGARAGLVFAALALVVASIGIAIVGSPPQESVRPSPSAPPSLTPAPSGATTSHITVLVTAGQPIDLAVVDLDDVLTDAASVLPADGASIDPSLARATIDPANPSVLTVLWSGMPCQTRGTLVVDAQLHRVTVGAESCSGDAVALDRIVRLTFAAPLAGATWVAVVSPLGSTASPDGGSPSPAPSSPAADLELVLREAGGERATMKIVDGSGHLVSAQALTVGESESYESLTAANVDERTVKIGWPGAPCDTVHVLTIAPDFGLTIDRPKCYGDSVPAFYAVQLVFDQRVDAGAMDLGLFDGRIASGLPTSIVTGIDAAGGRYDLAIYDASGRLVLPEPRSGDTQPPDPGPTGWALDRISDADGRLTWRAPACAISQVLRIDATAATWDLGWQPCASADPTTLRVLDLQFDHLPDTTGITVTIGGPGS